MRQALRQKAPAKRGPVAQAAVAPPPTGGWNARDPIAAMAATDAVRLDNFIPDTGGVKGRKGFAVHASGLVGDYVETLMEYASSVAGTNKLFAATPSRIYDVSVPNTPVSSVTGLTNGRWSHTMFSSGSIIDVLYLCNGADQARYYNGSAWTLSAFTGIATTNLDYVTAHVGRLWFIEQDSSSIWYGPAASVAGALTEFPVQAQLKRGGRLVAAGSWSRDGGDGMDDFFVLISSEGEVLIYQGSDPASASTWQKVGLFQLAEPVGRRCLYKSGGDLSILTSQGLQSLQQSLGINESGSQAASVTNKIVNAFRSVYSVTKNYHGWQVQEYPRKNLMLVNVPIAERAQAHQYVMNVLTGAWCRFTGANAGSWSLFNDDLYFGANDGKVHKFDTTSQDNGQPIVGIMQQAYTDFGHMGTKRFTQARPMLTGPSDYSPQVYLRTDFDTSPGGFAVAIPAVGGISLWDEAAWDSGTWSLGEVPSMLWQTVAAMGVVGSVTFAIQLRSDITYNGTQILFEPGSVFGG